MPFLALPREIRNHIYDYVFEEGSVYLYVGQHGTRSSLQKASPHFHDDSPCFKNWRQTTVSASDIALLLVNRQVSFEASASFYGKTTFGMDADDFYRFTEVLGVTKMSMLAHVEINLGGEEVPILSDILRRLSEIAILKTLRLDCEEDDFEAFKEKLIKICDIFAFAEKVDVEVCNITTIMGETDAFGTTEFVDEICTWGCKVGETEWWSDYDRMNWTESPWYPFGG